MRAIDSFSGEYRFLSNFYKSKVLLDGVEFPTVEHAYQASKFLVYEARERIRKARKASEAKFLGRSWAFEIWPGWNDLRLGIMEDLVRQKFQKEPLKTQLLQTYDAELVEGNTWGDVFWGVCKGKGLNHLGKILMKVREELRKEHNERREQ